MSLDSGSADPQRVFVVLCQRERGPAGPGSWQDVALVRADRRQPNTEAGGVGGP